MTSSTPSETRTTGGTRSGILSVRSAIVIVTGATMVLAVAVAALIWMWQVSVTDAATERSRDELRRSAGGIVAQVFSVDATTWQDDRARARGLVGGAFAARYATELTRPPTAGARAVTWTPEIVGIIDAGPDEGEVLIRAKVVTTPEAGAASTEQRSVTAGFERTGDRWVLTRVGVVS
ncbi:hypothetical protein [Gordonia insulae]|uniref:Mce-associated membrane protein n=1 Tax=Gordonia insulae TaxID=2420509 RepID=A0A3G8JUR5_9ACTN|nr:hypothetical protein [Gordonia insulae]AZG48299.1 hypothetical protein D7316_04916 [Gordonia insulae]